MQRPTARTIQALYARLHFGKVLNVVKSGKRELVILHSGKPIAAIISIDTYLTHLKPKQPIERLQPEIIISGIDQD